MTEVSDEYVQQTDDCDEAKVNPSDRILPGDIVSNRPLANLLTRNWRDNASALTNPVEKQLMAFMMILAFIYLGGCIGVAGGFGGQATLAVTYGASSMAGYFGFGNAPIARLSRVNGIAIFGAAAGLATFVAGAATGPLMLLTILYLLDIFWGAVADPVRSEDDYEILPPQSNDYGPLINFFTQSWRNNSINRTNY